MRILIEALLRLRDANLDQQLERTRARFSARRAEVIDDAFDNLLADLHDRIQAGHRVLEDHRHLRAAQGPPGFRRKIQQVLTHEPQLRAFQDARVAR